jgi:chaperonin cofactor prefoldin
MCRCGCDESHGTRHRAFDFPQTTVEEEVEALEEMKETMEKRLETMNKRLEILKKPSHETR